MIDIQFERLYCLWQYITGRKGHKVQSSKNIPEANKLGMLANMADDLEGEIPFQTLWNTTKASKEDISKQTDKITNQIQIKLIHIESSMSMLSEQMAEFETQVSAAAKDDLRDTRSITIRLKKDISYLKDKMQDLENRRRRSNIHIVNFPKKSEGGNMSTFLEHFIPEILGPENFPSPLINERAHRTGNIYLDRPTPIDP